MIPQHVVIKWKWIKPRWETNISSFKMFNFCFDECAVIERTLLKAWLEPPMSYPQWIVCAPQTHWISHWIIGRPAGTGRYWFSNRVERVGTKYSTKTRGGEKGVMWEEQRIQERKEGRKGWVKKVLGRSLKLYQCHLFLLVVTATTLLVLPCRYRAAVRALTSTTDVPPAYRLYNAAPASSSLHRQNNSFNTHAQMFWH